MQHQFQVQGMSCNHCEQSITKAVLRLDAAAIVRIERDKNLVQIDSTQARAALQQAIADEGYPAG